MNELSNRLGHYTPYINYMQRSELDQHSSQLLPHELDHANKTAVDLNLNLPISLVRVTGVARQKRNPNQNIQYYRSADIIAGLHGQREPLYFLILGEISQTRLFIGSIAEKNMTESIQTLLRSQYPGVQLHPSEGGQDTQSEIRQFLANCTFSGILTGVPVPYQDQDHPASGNQIDRMIRGMTGTSWAFLVIAEPKDESHIIEQKLALYNEQNRLEQEEGFRDFRESRISTIAAYYHQMLEEKHDILDSCLFDGGWSVQTYLASPDLNTYNRLKALVKSTFSGDVSKGVRLRVTDSPQLSKKIASFSPVLAPRPLPPSNELRINESNTSKYMTLLSSSILSALIHLPTLEMPGFFVRDAAIFDVASHTPISEPSIKLGEILNQGTPTGNSYRVRVEDLTRHALLVGITGSGKTNTGFYLLQQCLHREPPVPFLVIEPAKREYRNLLLQEKQNHNIQIFTVGEETNQSAPFRINPFEINPGVPVQTHIDLIKSVFNASFGMWAPLPQVLERAIIGIYMDKGWDPVHNTNTRGKIDKGWHSEAQPTLTDLSIKIMDLVPTLGYDMETTRNVQTALETRINSLRVGAKGMMLDTPLSIPIEALLKHPTVLELEGIGDDDEKVFLMGLVLIRLYEYLRANNVNAKGLQHITVIEEAHRLLSNTQMQQSADVGNPRAKAVETFVNMLSEVRAYGEAFLVAEQIPTKLAPDVIKNTALKIMHRTVSSDDRIAMGNAMNLSPEQLRHVVALETGQAVVYAGGKFSDDNPILISVPLAKDSTSKKPIDHDIHQNWIHFLQSNALEDIFHPYPTCREQCRPLNQRCRQLKESSLNEALRNEFQRLFLTIVAEKMNKNASSDSTEIIGGFTSLIRQIQYSEHAENMGREDIHCAVTHLLYDFLRRRGATRGWPFRIIIDLAESSLPVFLSLIEESVTSEVIEKMSNAFIQQMLRNTGPHFGCDALCPTINGKRLCLYKEAARLYINQEFFQNSYEATAYQIDDLISLAEGYANRIIGSQVDDYFRNCAGLCFIIQEVSSDQNLSVTAQRNLISQLLEAIQVD